jgi:Domain of unknown function (DUF397)
MNATWFKSSFSFSNGNCVEVAELPGRSVGIRDSRDPGGPVLRFTRGEWDAFLGGARRGAFDRSGGTASGRVAPDRRLPRPPRGLLEPVLDAIL